MLLDVVLDACLDTLKLFPFLLATYLLMEWLEHGASARITAAIARGGRSGPVIASVLGLIPQCGLSGAAATLYAGRVITLGTLVATFLVTSDEMLPLMLGAAAPPALIAHVLAVKFAAGLTCGLVLDAVLAHVGRLHTGLASRARHEGHAGHDIGQLCEQEGCACAHDGHAEGHASELGQGQEHVHAGGIVVPALKHAARVSAFVFVITLCIGLVVELGFDAAVSGAFGSSYAGVVLAALVGLVPNCAVSVGVTQLYLDGLLSGGALMAALCVNAGVGLLVLLRTNHDARENAAIVVLLAVLGTLIGLLTQACGVL